MLKGPEVGSRGPVPNTPHDGCAYDFVDESLQLISYNLHHCSGVPSYGALGPRARAASTLQVYGYAY